jgi:hypothetical protein
MGAQTSNVFAPDSSTSMILLQLAELRSIQSHGVAKGFQETLSRPSDVDIFEARGQNRDIRCVTLPISVQGQSKHTESLEMRE